MRVICTDGTTFECEAYELTDYGVMVYSQPHEPDEDRYAKTPDQIAYVPHDRLWYILPDGVEPWGPPVAAGPREDAPAPANQGNRVPVEQAGGTHGQTPPNGPGQRR